MYGVVALVRGITDGLGIGRPIGGLNNAPS